MSLSTALKTHRETENKVHEQLYKNIALLTYIYPTSNDFKSVFKSDMFVKKNSAAFQQVSYYLLSILDPVLLKKKVVSWPIYDPKSETQFRIETMKYLNELNGIYTDANLPTVLMSQIVSPGGLRFAKYMLKLSQLVLTEHLKSRDLILCRSHPNKKSAKTVKTIEKLQRLTQSINEDTEQLKSNFETEVRVKRQAAERIMKELSDCCDLVPKLRRKLEKLQSEMKDESINLNIVDSEEELVVLTEKLRKILTIKEKSDTIVDLTTSLLKPDLFYEYKPEIFPRELRGTTDDLNLLNTLRKFNLFLENKCFEMTPTNNDELQANVDKFHRLNQDLRQTLKGLQKVKDSTVKLHQELQEYEKPKVTATKEVSIKAKEIRRQEDSEEVLACPLDSSGDSTLGILHFDD